MILVARSSSPGGRRAGSLHERVEDRAHDTAGALVLGPDLGAEIHPLEHERAQGEHRVPHLVALDDVARGLGRLDEVVDERVDPLRAGRAQQLDLVHGKVPLGQEPVAQRVVDVVVDVRDPVDDADDLPFVRLGLALARVREDPVADLVGEVQFPRDPERLLVVQEVAAEALAQGLVERLLACVPERRVTGVVPEPDRLHEVLVQPQRAGDDTGDRGRLERVGHAGAVVVALRVDEDLGLPLQPAERLRVDDPVAVALERRPDAARLLLALAAARRVRADGERRQRRLLQRSHALGERVRDTACDLHASSVVAAPARSSYACRADRRPATPIRRSGTVRRRPPRTPRRPMRPVARRGT